MNVNGREIGVRRTVLANCKLTEAAPDRDIRRFFTELIASHDYVVAQKAAAQLIAALNEGYEQYLHFVDPEHKPVPVNAETLLSLDEATFNALYQEALKAYTEDGKTTVEVDPPKGKKTVKKRGAST